MVDRALAKDTSPKFRQNRCLTRLYAIGASIFCLGIWLLLAGLDPRHNSLTSLIFLFIAHLGLASTLAGFLTHSYQPVTRGYRLAFGLSFVPVLLYWIVIGLIHLLGLNSAAGISKQLIDDLLIIFAGVFSGCLVGTARWTGLWENNAPPSQVIQDQVLDLHRQVIGSSFPESTIRRAFDFGLALLGLIVSLPAWLLIVLWIWLEDPGPLLFVKNSVGKGGVNFRQLKFRTMVQAAEQETGPIIASENDERVLWIGRLLRKTALDELPQLVNILCGEMSFVGPRPQRTVLVYDYLQNIPEYAGRHVVNPGLAGLAQVAGDYFLTPHQKLRYDRLYIKHRSPGFDLKLLLIAFLVTFWFRWKKDWNGRLPRRLVRFPGKT